MIEVEIYSIAIPLLLPGMFTWAMLLPKYKKVFHKPSVNYAFAVLTWFIAMAPLPAAIKYLTVKTGDVTSVKNLSDNTVTAKTCYYILEDYDTDSTYAHHALHEVGASDPAQMGIDIYFVAPLVNKHRTKDENNIYKYWISKDTTLYFNKSLDEQLRNKQVNEYISTYYKDFTSGSELSKVKYFERLQSTFDREDIFNAIQKAAPNNIDEDLIILKPETRTLAESSQYNLEVYVFASLFSIAVYMLFTALPTNIKTPTVTQ